MDIKQIREKSKESNKSSLAKGWRELSSPLGLSLLSILIPCGVLLLLVEYIGKRLNISQSIITVVAIIIIVIALLILIIRISKAAKESQRRHKDAYEQKFGGKKRDGR